MSYVYLKSTSVVELQSLIKSHLPQGFVPTSPVKMSGENYIEGAVMCTVPNTTVDDVIFATGNPLSDMVTIADNLSLNGYVPMGSPFFNMGASEYVYAQMMIKYASNETSEDSIGAKLDKVFTKAEARDIIGTTPDNTRIQYLD